MHGSVGDGGRIVKDRRKGKGGRRKAEGRRGLYAERPGYRHPRYPGRQFQRVNRPYDFLASGLPGFAGASGFSGLPGAPGAIFFGAMTSIN